MTIQELNDACNGVPRLMVQNVPESVVHDYSEASKQPTPPSVNPIEFDDFDDDIPF